MVSFENGKFILRHRDDRQQMQSRRRSILKRRVILIALAVTFFYSVHKSLEQRQTISHKALRDVNIDTPHTRGISSDIDDDDDSVKSSQNNEQSPKEDMPVIEEVKSSCNVSLNQKYIQYLQTLKPIPKKVHIFVSSCAFLCMYFMCTVSVYRTLLILLITQHSSFQIKNTTNKYLHYHSLRIVYYV